MQVDFDKDKQVFRIALDGRVDMPRVVELLTAMLKHPDFRPGIPAIWDAGGADLSPLKIQDMQQFRLYQAQHANVRGQARVALVAANDLSFGLGRMFELVADLPHLKINVFRDIETAENWALSRDGGD